jgi:hypothetical protein
VGTELLRNCLARRHRCCSRGCRSRSERAADRSIAADATGWSGDGWTGGARRSGDAPGDPDGEAATPRGLGTRNYGGGRRWSREGEIVVRMVGWSDGLTWAGWSFLWSSPLDPISTAWMKNCRDKSLPPNCRRSRSDGWTRLRREPQVWIHPLV